MSDIELLKLALQELEDLVNLAEHVMTDHPYGEWDVKAELEGAHGAISLLRARLADV